MQRLTPLLALLAAAAQAQTCPTFNLGPKSVVVWSTLRCVNDICDRNFTPRCNEFAGDAPFTYRWEYDTTGSGDWVPFPASSSPIEYNGTRVGLGIGGQTHSISGFADFAVGLYLVIPTRLTITNSCGSAVHTAALWFCHADFNSDFGVDVTDYQDFLAAFATESPAGDFNRDGSIDWYDYLDFLNAYAAGCSAD